MEKRIENQISSQEPVQISSSRRTSNRFKELKDEKNMKVNSAVNITEPGTLEDNKKGSIICERDRWGYAKKHKKSPKIVSNKPTTYKCDKCSKVYVGKSSLVIHMRKHTGETPFMCDLCGKCFISKSTLICHKVFHTNVKNFKCNICEKSFHTKFTLSRHKLAHSKLKSFICEQCGSGFTTKIYLQRHIARHNGIDQNWKRKFLASLKPLTTCDICGRKRRDIKEHVKIHNLKREHMCKICGHSFISVQYLNKHKRKHDWPRKYTCSHSDCKWAFKEMCMLRRHELTHNNPSYKCSACAATFNNEDQLKKHRLLHSGLQRTYVCTICNRPFTKADKLENHLRVHSGEKPFKCEICYKAFSQRYTRDRHAKTVHKNDSITSLNL